MNWPTGTCANPLEPLLWMIVGAAALALGQLISRAAMKDPRR